MSSAVAGRVRRLLAETNRGLEEAGARADEATVVVPRAELLDLLRDVPELLVELESASRDVERLENRSDEITDRLRVTELALRSAYEARDSAVALLGDVRGIVADAATGTSDRDVVEAVRRLSEAQCAGRKR